MLSLEVEEQRVKSWLTSKLSLSLEEQIPKSSAVDIFVDGIANAIDIAVFRIILCLIIMLLRRPCYYL
jgi:hypothetical protein